MAARTVPWHCWAEWRSVLHLLCLLPEEAERRAEEVAWAVRRGRVWRERGRLPAAVECVLSLAESVPSPTNKRPLDRASVSMALIRLVNGVTAPAQKGRNPLSVSILASQAQLPRLLVDIRHEATHNALPSSQLLLLAAAAAREWVRACYLLPQEELLRAERVRGVEAALRLMEGGVECAGRKRRRKAQELSEEEEKGKRAERRVAIKELLEAAAEPKDVSEAVVTGWRIVYGRCQQDKRKKPPLDANVTLADVAKRACRKGGILVWRECLLALLRELDSVRQNASKLDAWFGDSIAAAVVGVLDMDMNDFDAWLTQETRAAVLNNGGNIANTVCMVVNTMDCAAAGMEQFACIRARHEAGIAAIETVRLSSSSAATARNDNTGSITAVAKGDQEEGESMHNAELSHTELLSKLREGKEFAGNGKGALPRWSKCRDSWRMQPIGAVFGLSRTPTRNYEDLSHVGGYKREEEDYTTSRADEEDAAIVEEDDGVIEEKCEFGNQTIHLNIDLC